MKHQALLTKLFKKTRHAKKDGISVSTIISNAITMQAINDGGKIKIFEPLKFV